MNRTPLRVTYSQPSDLRRWQAWCSDIDEHQEMIVQLTSGLDPFGDREQVVRALPDPGSWFCVGQSFVRRFACGCVVSVHFG